MFDGNKCLDQYAFWIVILTFEMLLNVVLTIIPLYILWNLRVRRAQKFAILCCFGTRMLIVGALIGETVLLHKVEHSRDLILNAWTSTIASQVVLSLSFIIPCLPYLKPFLESLDSGILGNEFYEESHRIGQSTTRSKTNATGDSSFTLQRLGGRSKLSTKISSRSYDVTLGKERLPSDDVTTPYKGIKRSNMSVGSNASQSKMIKVRTSLDWEVEREHDHEGIE
ncbi:hypothetical protein EAF04_010350 [Stromatinia cepivora]|nr:hypothetical protein EAF04_010350 [Stromatinia cepivora]